MPKYVVQVYETCSKNIIIEAENPDKARELAEDVYYSNKINLDKESFDECGVDILREATDYDLENFEEY